jgi:succinate dehydrogenase / fumarate reductase membrane anchor subunit
MVKKLTNVISLTGNGLRDWLIQRVTSVVMAVYILFLLGFFLTHSSLQFSDWQALFALSAMKIFSVVFLLSLIWHAWIGIWTVITDYIKPFGLRLFVHVVVVLALFIYLIWGIHIFWSV